MLDFKLQNGIILVSAWQFPPQVYKLLGTPIPL